MDDRRGIDVSRLRVALLLVMGLLNLNLEFCLSLNAEGLSLLKFREGVLRDPFGALSDWGNNDVDIDPCSWYGVECSEGNVVILNLRDLCLEGTLAPELWNLNHIKSIILRNNSFSGPIPKDIRELKELEVLDLGCNNFSGPLPSDLINNLSLAILLIDNNKFLGGISPELHELSMLSELQVDDNHLKNAARGASCDRRSIVWNVAKAGSGDRRLLQLVPPKRKTKKKAPSPSPSPSRISPASASSPAAITNSSSSTKPPTSSPSSNSNHSLLLILSGVGGASLIFILFIGFLIYRSKKMVPVKPWVTGLSGQLQKAFVTGVPKLKRSELEAACEDFSNIIDSSSNYTVYKGTLSNGVEIAVTSTAVTSANGWSMHLEDQFRKKLETLSKVNHKNFVNLLGYCDEEEPFTRMMVFEYAPNGTLFEHLHIKESEHLDWGARLRVAMGIAYCLDYMHQMNPPVAHKNLRTSSICLSEDYAAKISDIGFWNDAKTAKMGSTNTELLETLEGNVYSFAVILLDMITGMLAYSRDSGLLVDWASDFLKGVKPFKDMVDPTLKYFREEELEKLCVVIKYCILPDPNQRPTMREVTDRLREITGMGPDGATPRLSPLWWAELEILSTEAN